MDLARREPQGGLLPYRLQGLLDEGTRWARENIPAWLAEQKRQWTPTAFPSFEEIQAMGRAKGPVSPDDIASFAVDMASPFAKVGGLLGVTRGTSVAPSLLELLNAKYPEVDAYITQRNGLMSLDKLIVPKEMRRQGVGSAYMQDLTNFADQNNLGIVLSASGDFGGTKTGQKRFYKRHGFVENKGRNKDFSISENMHRRQRRK